MTRAWVTARVEPHGPGRGTIGIQHKAVKRASRPQLPPFTSAGVVSLERLQDYVLGPPGAVTPSYSIQYER